MTTKSKIVRCGLIQCSNPINDEKRPVAEIQKAMVDKHIVMIEEAGRKGVQILCLQEIFNGPYFCPSQDPRWYEAAEAVPGPTTDLIASYAKKHAMVVVVVFPWVPPTATTLGETAGQLTAAPESPVAAR